MKRFFISMLALAAIVSFAACSNEDDEIEEKENTGLLGNNEEPSLIGRWDFYIGDDVETALAEGEHFLSVIFGSDNRMVYYIIRWGWRFEGSYSIEDGDGVYFEAEVGYEAHPNDAYDEYGVLVNDHWSAEDLDEETLELVDGFKWYDMSDWYFRQYQARISCIGYGFLDDDIAQVATGFEEKMFMKRIK